MTLQKFPFYYYILLKANTYNFFAENYIEDLPFSPIPIHKLNWATQVSIVMEKYHQQYSEILFMPTYLRHELVKAAIATSNKQK